MGFNLVAVPFHDWKKSQSEGFRTRDVHLLQEFIKHPFVDRLLIVDRPTSVIEMLVLRRRWHISGGEVVYQNKHNRLTQINDKTYVLDMYSLEVLRPLIHRRRWIPASYGEKTTCQAVLEAVNYMRMDAYVLFLSSPLPIPLYRQLGKPTLVVDAVDNMLKIPQYSRLNPVIREYYDEIRLEASIIFSNTMETVRFLSQKDKPAVYIPNGVDFNHFRVNDRNVADDLKQVHHPIVGYAGKMQEIFDVEMILEVAKEFPDVTFVCIGQLLNPKWMKTLWKLPNVKYLGDKYYDQLPSYLENFDICMIPYNLERQHDNDPIKFYEYLAMGKPVITTRIGGVEAFSNDPHVRIIDNTLEFKEALRYFLSIDYKKIPKIILPDEILWSTKANKIINQIYTEIISCESLEEQSKFAS